jgi:MscS family membrane protein
MVPFRSSRPSSAPTGASALRARLPCCALWACSLAVLLLFAAVGAQAQPPQVGGAAAVATGEADAGVEPEEMVARDSPRASITDFHALARAGDYESAAGYLELASEDKALGPELARKLKAVLDREAWVDPDSLSPLPTGNLQDSLPGLTDELGQIEGPDGLPQPVRIVRRRRDGVRWVFSAATVSRIEGWYERLEDRWMLEHLPKPLLRVGPRELMWWQWLALPLLIVTSLLVGMGLSKVTEKLLCKLAAHSSTSWDDAMVARMKRPFTLWWMLAVAYLILPFLALYEPAEEFVLGTMHTLFLVGLFWALARIIDVGAEAVFRSPWATTRAAAGSLVSLGARVAKVAVVVIAAVALLSELGYPVASILAGLGVGGLAVALAAQKTVENLFGAFSIGADQPFREGDLVRVDDFVGNVELIGLRSTKFRTADRTLISIPNGKLADMKLETFAVRDRLRFAAIVGLSRSTTAQQLRQVMEGFESLLKSQPKLFQNSANVRFEKFGPSSLDLDVSAYFDTRDFGEFQLIRQELLLQFMQVIERAGTSLALPATSVQLMNGARPAPAANATSALS